MPTNTKFIVGWEPEPRDILWMQNLIRITKDGATGAVPGNATIYRVEHANRRFVFMEGNLDEIFYRTRVVLEKLGWTLSLPDSVSMGAGAGKISPYV